MATTWNPEAVVDINLAPSPSSPRLGVTKKGRRHGQTSMAPNQAVGHRPPSASAGLPELANLTLPGRLFTKLSDPEVEAKCQLWWRPVRTGQAARRNGTVQQGMGSFESRGGNSPSEIARMAEISTPRVSTTPLPGAGLSEGFRSVVQAYHAAMSSERLPHETAFTSRVILTPNLRTTLATPSPSAHNPSDPVPSHIPTGSPTAPRTGIPSDSAYRSVRARAGRHHLITYYFHPPPSTREIMMCPTFTPRRSLEDTNGCPICTEEIYRDEDAVWCRAQCGQNMHRECFQQWKRYCEDASRSVTCPYCRRHWRLGKWDWE